MRRDQHVRFRLADNLEVCAAIAARYRLAERAARLHGAAAALKEQIGEVAEPGSDQLKEQYRRNLTRARAQIGAVAFAQARSAGWELTSDEAVSEALKLLAAISATPERPLMLGTLTPRENEVARLVARGLTNHQIAAQLVFTEATAAKHVEHILDKLGLTSRVQIAGWLTLVGPDVVPHTVT
jgi:non-specific serine/threonine protein kinase